MATKKIKRTASTAIFAGLILLAGSGARAQMTQIRPNGTGGYNVYAPGQMPAQVLPNGTGGYNVFGAPPPPAYVPQYVPPVYSPNPYIPRGYEPFNGQSAGEQLYGRQP